MQLSDADLDLMARTMLSEAGPKASPTEQAAIAHVILNRAAAGGEYGDGISGVIQKKGQFEPWSLPPGHPNSPTQVDPSTPAYQTAAAIAQSAADGKVADPTNGATYFLQPDIVMHRVQAGQMSWPEWAAGKGQRIGQHVFYSPDATSAQQNAAARDYSQLDARYPAAPEPGTTPQTSVQAAPAADQWQASLESRYPAPPAAGEQPQGGAAPNARVAQGFQDVQPVSSLNRSGEAPTQGPLGAEAQAKFNRFMNALVSDPEKAAKENPGTVAMLVAMGGPAVVETGAGAISLAQKAKLDAAVKVALGNRYVQGLLGGAGMVTGAHLDPNRPLGSLLEMITGAGGAH